MLFSGYGLCRGRSYDKHKHICCNGALTQMYIPSLECCGSGSEPYDPTSSICCNGVLSRRYIPSMQCCGSQPYNPQFRTCCGLKISFPGGQQCCGTQPYSKSKQTCCRRHLTSGVGKSCCADQAFDPSTYQCWLGKVVPRWICEAGVSIFHGMKLNKQLLSD